MRGRWFALIAALVLAVAACGAAEDAEVTQEPAETTAAPETTTTTTSSTTTTTLSTTTTTASDELDIDWVYSDPSTLPEVTLLDPGAEPHAVRVYEPVVGTSTTATMVQELEVSQSIGGAQFEIATETTSEMTIEVLGVTDEGIITRTTFGDFTVTSSDPGVEASTEAALVTLLEEDVYELTSPRGELLATSSLDLLPGMEAFSGGMGSAGAPLPTEPFGVGALWEVKSAVIASGMEFVQTTTVRVTDIDGALLTVEFEIEQNLGPEGLVLPGLEDAEVVADLISGGTGSAVWDLAAVFPQSSVTELLQTLDATVTFEGETESLDQTVRVSMEVFRSGG